MRENRTGRLGSLGQPLNSDAGLTLSKEESGLRKVEWKSPTCCIVLGRFKKAVGTVL